jgi:hypothetical protein
VNWSSHGAVRPRRLIAVAITALVPLLAGCEAGNNAPTNQWHQPTQGASATLGSIVISNVFVLGPSIGGQLSPGDSASLFFAVTNTGAPDKLTSITAPGSAASVTIPNNTVNLASNKAVLLTGPAPKATVNQISRVLTGSSAIKLVMTFQNAGTVTLQVPVVPMANYFATFSPAPLTPPTPSPSKSGKSKPVKGSTPTPTPSS